MTGHDAALEPPLIPFSLAKRLTAEGLGSLLLVAVVVGSGIMGERLAAGNMAVALLANAVATGAALIVLITVLGPISGAHFNPVVTAAFLVRRELTWPLATCYVLVQVAGVIGLAALGAALPLRYVGLLSATLLVFFVVADLGAARLSASAASANRFAARLSSALGDVVRNAERVVFNGALEPELSRLARCANDRHQAQRAMAVLIRRSNALQVVLLAFGQIALLVLAGGDVAAGRLSLGAFVLLQAFAFRLALPLSGLAIMLRQTGAPFANVREALALVNTPAAAAAAAGPKPKSNPELILTQVNFIYPNSTSGLRDITLALVPNQLVVIVGSNGSGKSTLARLMAGLLNPSEGQITVGGADVTAIPLEQRAQTILYVPQFISLFNRTLGENGLYPPAHLTLHALAERLDQWRFDPSRGAVDLHAMAGEHGAGLSGGQVQKLELARICAVEAPILILDESTSALDQASEDVVMRTLRAQFAQRLLVVVTHRQALAEAADRVIFVDQGRLAGFGSHGSLMGTAPYNQLWAGGCEGNSSISREG